MKSKTNYNTVAVRQFLSWNFYQNNIGNYRRSRVIVIAVAVIAITITTWYSLDVRKGKVDIYFLILFFVIITIGSLYAEKIIRNRMLTDHNGHMLDVFIYNTMCLPSIIFSLFVLLYVFAGVSAVILSAICYISSLMAITAIAKISINHALETDLENAFVKRTIGFLENEYIRPTLIITMIVLLKSLGMTGVYVGFFVAGISAIYNVIMWNQLRIAKEYNCEKWLPNGTTVEN